MGSKSKTYGLVLPAAARAITPAVAPARPAAPPPAAFGYDDDDDGGDTAVEARATLSREQAHVSRVHHAAAAAEDTLDSEIYDYDNFLDAKAATTSSAKTGSNRAATSSAAAAAAVPRSSLPKESRYIGALLSKAAERGVSREAAHERKLAREREKEDAEFGEKEKFVTGAYRAVLAERAAREDAEKLAAAREAAADVTKKGDLSGFYRNLLTNNVALGGGAGAVGSHAGEGIATSQQQRSTPVEQSQLRLEQQQPAALRGSTAHLPARDLPHSSSHSAEQLLLPASSDHSALTLPTSATPHLSAAGPNNSRSTLPLPVSSGGGGGGGAGGTKRRRVDSDDAGTDAAFPTGGAPAPPDDDAELRVSHEAVRLPRIAHDTALPGGGEQPGRGGGGGGAVHQVEVGAGSQPAQISRPVAAAAVDAGAVAGSSSSRAAAVRATSEGAIAIAREAALARARLRASAAK